MTSNPEVYNISPTKSQSSNDHFNNLLLEFNTMHLNPESSGNKFQLIKEIVYNNKYHKTKYIITKSKIIKDRIPGMVFFTRYQDYKFLQHIIILLDYDFEPYFFTTHGTNSDLRGYTTKILETPEFTLHRSDNEGRNLHIKFKTLRLSLFK